MLVLTRKTGQRLVIGDDVVVVVVSVRGDKVQIGIEADESIKILRGELEDEQPRKAA